MFADVHKNVVISGKLSKNCLDFVLYAFFFSTITLLLLLHVFVCATGINSGLSGKMMRERPSIRIHTTEENVYAESTRPNQCIQKKTKSAFTTI